MTIPFIPQPRSHGAVTAPRVVVGVDGSAASLRALVWALEYADVRGFVVEVVTVWPLHAPVFVRETPGHFNDARWKAVQAQRQAIAHARELFPAEVAVTTCLANATPADGLLAVSVDAALLVLGGSEPAADGRSGTLAEALQVAASCPIVVVADRGEISERWGHRALVRGLKETSVN